MKVSKLTAPEPQAMQQFSAVNVIDADILEKLRQFLEAVLDDDGLMLWKFLQQKQQMAKMLMAKLDPPKETMLQRVSRYVT